MADSLPNINFGFDELRERMAKFTDRFDDFIARGRKRVLEERNQFRINVAELQGRFFRRSLPPYSTPRKIISKEKEIPKALITNSNMTIPNQRTDA